MHMDIFSRQLEIVVQQIGEIGIWESNLLRNL